MFASNPVCVICAAAGKISIAKHRDHIVPISQGGSDTADNTQPLCLACHEIKSKQESAHGRVKRWGGGG